MTYEEIQELNGTQPYSFESDREEQWYKCGLVEGADVAYTQAEKDYKEKMKGLLNKAKNNITESTVSEERKVAALSVINALIMSL